MKVLTTAIYSKISGSSLSTAIGGRFYKNRAPEDAEYPYVVYMIVTDTPDYNFKTTIEDVIIQFSIFSAKQSSTEAENLYGYLKTLYDDCTFTVTGSSLIWMIRQNAILMVEDHTVSNGTIQVWHYAVDYNIKTEK